MSATRFGLPVAALFFGFMLASFVFWYVSVEHPAYLWDFGGYFDLYQKMGDLKSESLARWAGNILRSVRSDDYNVSSVVLMSPVFDVLGSSRTAYVLGIVFLYVIPAAIIAVVVFQAALTAELPERPIAGTLTAFCLALSFPPLWQAALRGMPDVVGLVPLGLATLVIFKTDFLSRDRVRSAAKLGLLLWLTFMLRRWYAYACVSVIFCTYAVMVARAARADNRLYELAKATSTVLLAGAVGAIFLLVLQFDLAVRVVTTSYADLYAGYKAPLLTQIGDLYNRSGLLFLFLSGTGLVLAAVKKEFKLLFLASAAVLTFAIFSRTQSPAVQHGLPIFFLLLPAAMYPFWIVIGQLGSKASNAAAAGLSLLCALVFMVSFIPRANDVLPWVAAISPLEKYYPLHLENFSNYQQLISKLHDILGPEDRFVTVASSEHLSDSLLRAIDPSLEQHIAWASQVDERDGLRLEPLRSKYAVVASPTPLHLVASSQSVVTIPSEMIQSGTAIGESYRKLPGSYELAKGYVASIYERVQPLTGPQIAQLVTELRQFHPLWEIASDSLIFLK